MLRFLARAFQQSVYVAAMQGLDATGKPSYGAPVKQLGRVEGSEGVRRTRGTENTVSFLLFTLGPIGSQDRIWALPEAVAAVEASLAAPTDAGLAAAAAALARAPSAKGCTPQLDLRGVVNYYMTELA